ncbi:MAG: hypothetical protein ACOY3Y_02760 [Acidobacteriota bacterium]
MRTVAAIGLLGALVLTIGCGGRGGRSDTAGIFISRDPEQSAADGEGPIRLERDGWSWTLRPLRRYAARGVVVGVEGYSSGWQAGLAPCDVALVWGPLVEEMLYRRLDWSQSGRWYFWRYPAGFGHDNTFIARHSSNTHVIPRNRAVERAACGLDEGDVVELSGLLVRADGVKGGSTVWWESSTSRDDTGDGSCEVLYVTRVRAHRMVWE